MKIMFTGTQGTGKTTLANEFKDDTLVYTNGIRALIEKYKLDHSENSTELSQLKIFNNYKKFVKSTVDFISDRSLIDVLAYTKYLYDHFKISKEFFDKQQKYLKKFINDNPDIVYCYFPIEFNVENDGTRSIDENYRKEIDNNIKSLLTLYNIDYIEISGSFEDRKNIIYTIL